jgi:LPXTG-motif cell wall-anchored protein
VNNAVPPEENKTELYTDTQVYYRDNATVTTIGWESVPSKITAPAGYQFAGWDYGGHVYQSGQTFTVDISGTNAKYSGKDGDTNYVYVYAVYTKIDTTYIQYDANGGSGTLTDIGLAEGVTDNIQRNIALNETTMLSSGVGFTRTGYKLIGWNSVKDAADQGTVEWKLGDKVGVDGISNTLYAVWKRTASVTVKKTDDTGNKALTGAKFTFEKQNGNVWEAVQNYNKDTPLTISSEDGVEINDLDDGTYRLTETKAPDGYIISTSAIEFTINNGVPTGSSITSSTKTNDDGTTSTVYTLTVKNTPGKALPETGGPGTSGFLFGGLAMILAAGVVYLISKKRLV